MGNLHNHTCDTLHYLCGCHCGTTLLRISSSFQKHRTLLMKQGFSEGARTICIFFQVVCLVKIAIHTNSDAQKESFHG